MAASLANCLVFIIVVVFIAATRCVQHLFRLHVNIYKFI